MVSFVFAKAMSWILVGAFNTIDTLGKYLCNVKL
jgi:hypothetical protein